MAYNLNRIYSGLLVVLFLIFFYFSKLDSLLLLCLTITIIYEVFINKLFNLKFLPLLILFIFSFFYFDNLIIFNNSITFISIISLIFLSIYFYKYLVFFNLILLIFIFFCYELLQSDRLIFYIIILVSFINDTSAYFFGKLIKGPYIIPKVSPKKTWSGTLSSMIISFSFLFFYFDFSLIISTLVSLLFFLGDIYFSFIKRKYDIKDFSNIIPGHGGLLDRIDSFLFPIILVTISL